MNDNLIFEELSISNDVIEVGNKLLKDIIEGINNDIGYRVFKTLTVPTYLTKTYKINLTEPIFGLVNEVDTIVYFFETKDDARNSYNHFDYGGSFIENEKIVITCYGIGNVTQTDFLSMILHHELKHAYQESLYNRTKDIPLILKIATNVVCGNIPSNNNLVSDLSRLIYYFNRNEVSSNMESLYQYLAYDKPNELKTYICPTLQEYGLYISLYNKLRKEKIDKETCEIIKILYGKTFTQLLRMIKFGIEYFCVRKKKVFAKYQADRNKIMYERVNIAKRFFIR